MFRHHRRTLCATALVALTSCSAPTPSKPSCAREGCPEGQRCDAQIGECQSLAADAGAQPACSAPGDCAPPNPWCAPSGVCVECLLDADCPTGLCDLGPHACIAQPDTCQTARPLDLAGGSAAVRGNTARATDDMTASCAQPGSTGADLVYALTLGERRRVVAVAKPAPGSPLSPVLALRSACASIEPTANLGCSYAAPGGGEARLSVELPAGTFWLWVDGDGNGAGEFDLTVTAEIPMAGDTCNYPSRLLPFTGPIELVGNTELGADDAAGSCGGAGAADLVYEVKLQAAARLSAEVAPLSPGYQPVLYVRRAPCGSAQLSSQLACSRGLANAPRTASVDVPRLEAGSYFLFVDGSEGPTGQPTEGSFRLTLTVSEPLGTPANDTCAGAEPIDPPVGAYGTLSLAGTTALALNDSAGCGGSGPDLVYSLRLPAARRVSARLAPAAGSPLVPLLYLRKPGACDSELAQDQLACNAAVLAGSPASVLAPNLPAGNYYLWVDGAGDTKGAFELFVELSAPSSAPANDSCSAPQLLYPAAGPVTVTGTTTGATRDGDLSCVELPAGPDVVYEIVVPSQQSLALDLQATSGSQLKPVLALRKPGACPSTALADELLCAWGDPLFTGRAVYSVPALAAGHYFLWVQGDLGSHGPFSLRTALGPVVPPPPNDDCGSPVALPPYTPLTGNTRAALNDTMGHCGTVVFGSGETAGDVVYELTLATPQTVTITVSPDASDGQLLRPVVYVRGPGSAACGSPLPADQKGCGLASAYGAQVALTLQSLAAGTYSVWVDGAGQSSGKFTIKWQ